MIKAKNIIRSFKNGLVVQKVLKGINLEIAEKEFVAIVGRSGAGKSTLLYQLGLLDHPTEGSITIAGKEVTKMSSKERTRFRLEQLGYVFQDYAILPELTAYENVVLPLVMQGMVNGKAKAKAEKALELVGLADRLNNLPSQLSGGEQQRVSIARAIVNDPKILFADEPTANLDSVTATKVMDLLKSLHKQGQTIVMVTHETKIYADRIITIDDGLIVKEQKLKHKK